MIHDSHRRNLAFHFALCLFSAPLSMTAQTQAARGQTVAFDLEEEPLKYTATLPDNRVSKLATAIAKGRIKLDYDADKGYLRSLLKHLEISESSQVLVFSKTSLQVQHISPRNPRAVFFNDDTYVGWIPGSSLLEVSTHDPKLGAAFFSFQMSPHAPRIRRETYQCLGCHATSMTQGVPGHAVRSVQPNFDGAFDAKSPAFVTEDSSDFKQRWGGWYVTGSHGAMQHMGNTYVRGGTFDTSRSGNLQTLNDLFNVGKYLTPHSEIVALMVLEHQTQMHNAMTRADFSVRQWHSEGSETNSAERTVQLRALAKEVVDRLFFTKEFALTSPVSGTGGFEKEFVARGPADSTGRSLREFDLQTRMFKYPLSYLIYSEAFDDLQPVLRTEICRQIKLILESDEPAEEYRRLTPELRRQIREIVLATKPDILR